MTRTEFLECWRCAQRHPLEKHRLLCDCGSPLEVVYTHDAQPPRPKAGTADGVWRWEHVLPQISRAERVSLGEGGTPLIELPSFSARTGCRILLKDEGQNPGGSFKARGASVAVSTLRQLGWTAIAMPTVGSGGSAWSAYGARAGISVRVGFPGALGIPEIGVLEPGLYGAELSPFDGTLREAFAEFRSDVDTASTAFAGALSEPYRVEGEKTILFEVAEQLGWTMPDAVVWPTGGGAGLVGLAKAQEELARLGWIAHRDRALLVSAQHDSGAPIADALHSGAASVVESVPGGIAPGAWVGSPFAGDLILSRIRRSAKTGGVTVGDADILSTIRRVAEQDGVLLSPEGALAVAAAERGRTEGTLAAGSTVVCVNTAAAYRYPDIVRAAGRDA